jgi:hypothetical protein
MPAPAQSNKIVYAAAQALGLDGFPLFFGEGFHPSRQRKGYDCAICIGNQRLPAQTLLREFRSRKINLYGNGA